MRTLIDGGTLSTLPDRSRVRLLNLPVSRVRLRLPRRRGSVSSASQGRAGSTSAVDIGSRQRDSRRLRLLRRVMDRRVLEIIGVIRFAVLGQVRHPRLGPLPLTRRSPCE
jgi:hypothetical protein